MSQLSRLRDEVTLLSGADGPQPSHDHLLVYFIPGNPGHVEYYRQFLVEVRDALKASGREDVVVHGASHDGFETHGSPTPTAPYSLQEVIESTQRKVASKARELAGSDTPPTPVRVVLVGHSVGAYILLETVAWWQKQAAERKSLEIVGGVCLFPTVVDIAKSSKGKVFSEWLLMIPYLSLIAHFAARLLSWIPLWLWNWPKSLTPGEKLPEHTAVTEAVLRSPTGARQTVFMAADEMLEIREDRWHPANLWGVQPPPSKMETEIHAVASAPRTKLFFYWGEDDYWVDNDVRDRLIAKRATRQGDEMTADWPEMLIDKHKMDHCFSLNREHSELVATQVAGWVEKLLPQKE
ncbi:Hypothetical predicted protein [Lecanosticta acicola]|uniref:Lipid droplet-associated hydrolase n=1 Tax=Lecanosticta acicola TaxID=111012 RepID=A0AAI8Z8R9_9PEZI|nr:Hypothetical predicted protein [Lecanosticta acicola]